jgi:hypothetical protein
LKFEEVDLFQLLVGPTAHQTRPRGCVQSIWQLPRDVVQDTVGQERVDLIEEVMQGGSDEEGEGMQDGGSDEEEDSEEYM